MARLVVLYAAKAFVLHESSSAIDLPDLTRTFCLDLPSAEKDA